MNVSFIETIFIERHGDETESEGESNYDDDEGMDMLDITEEEKFEKERTVLNQKISVTVNGINIQKEEWIAVAYPRKWFPAQFIQFRPEEKELQVHFLERSTSNVNLFMWPGLCGEEPDIPWIDEGMFDFIISLLP